MTSSGANDVGWVDGNDKGDETKAHVSTFRNWICGGFDAKHTPEKGRYHLFVSYACPWSHRTLIARKLKGLENIITLSVLDLHFGEGSWRFVAAKENEPSKNVIPNPIGGHVEITHLYRVYFESDKEYQGRCTVPVLYDKKMKRIVNNESSEILRMLGSEFDHLVDEKYRGINIYPETLRSEIDDASAWQYDMINNGVYKCGFATTAEGYERSVLALFDALDRVEKHLQEQNGGPYYCGKMLTEVDIKLYVTIVRFDIIYFQRFKCNIRDIRSGYPALHQWLRSLYWNHLAFCETTHFEHIRWHYTHTHPQTNPPFITPLGPLPHILPLDQEVAAAEVIIKSNNVFTAGIIVSYFILAVIVYFW